MFREVRYHQLGSLCKAISSMAGLTREIVKISGFNSQISGFCVHMGGVK